MKIYRVAKKPDGPLGMLLYLLMARAGDGVVIGDDWYHFHRGAFTKEWAARLRRKRGYIVQEIGEATVADKLHFEQSIGKPWGFRYNCLTVVTWPLMRKKIHEQ